MLDLFQTGVLLRCPGGQVETVSQQVAAGMKWAALNLGTDPCVQKNPAVWDHQRALYRQANVPIGPWLHCRTMADVEWLVSVGELWPDAQFIGCNVEDVVDDKLSLQEVGGYLLDFWVNKYEKPVHMPTLPWVQNGQGWQYVSFCTLALEVFPEVDPTYLKQYQACIDHAFAEGAKKVTLLYSTQSARSIYPNVAHCLYTADNVTDWRSWKDSVPQPVPKPPANGGIVLTPNEKKEFRQQIVRFALVAEKYEQRWHYCVPVDGHRILTEDGFRHVDEIGSSRVAVIDHETREIRFEPPLEINRFQYDGPMYAVQSGRAEMLCTPEHMWPVESYGQTQRGRWYPGRRGMRSAESLSHHWAIPLTGRFDRGSSILSSRHAAILGWLVTDGSTSEVRGRLYGRIAQAETKFLGEIEGLLHRSAGTHRSSTLMARVSVPHEDMEIIERVYRDKNDLPQIAARLDREAAEAMWQAMMKAEGDFSRGEGRFSQLPGPVMEAFQILTFLTGRAGFVRGPYANGMQGLYIRTRDRLKWKARRIAEWSGEVWCPTTSTGTWIIERDGLLLPTGNSQARPYTGLGVPFSYTHHNDCSSYAALLYFAAQHAAQVAVADPLGMHYSGSGNTQTAYNFLKAHPAPVDKYRIGDIAIYGSAADTDHMTVCRKAGTGATAVWSSFGQEAGPEPRQPVTYHPSPLLGVYRHPALL